VVAEEVLDQPRRRGEVPTARGRAGAGREPAGAVVVRRLVVDDPARAAERLVGARHLGVAHDPVQLGAGDIGAGAGAGLDVAATTGAAHDVAGLALQPKQRQEFQESNQHFSAQNFFGPKRFKLSS